MKILIVDDERTALRDLERALRKVVPEAEISMADEVDMAVALCREQAFDVAFLDILMPEKDGLNLAREMKQIRPIMNIVMVTAYPQYALDAMKLYVSDYILKPAMTEDLKNALANLRNPVQEKQKGLFVRCFGNFEVFWNGEVVRFSRAKVKELFAYLIDRKGSTATNAELRAILWKDDVSDDQKQRKYFAQIVYELRQKLEELGCGEIFAQSRDSYALIPEKIPCDYYLALNREADAMARYEGEYMSQYEWAVNRLGFLAKN
ncbi:MAG: response regulator [Eubacterium sp.]|nr:response regulator [Eubacterium sp.]